MNGIVGWLKSNVVIVIFGVLIIALPIAGFFVSSGWNAKIKAAAEETLSSKKRLVDGVSRVTYSLPPIVAGEQAVEEARAPNAAVTAFFAAKRAERQEAIEGVVTQAVRFNKTEQRKVLLPGLLPGMDDAREVRRKTKELAAMIVGDDEQPSVYAQLFDSINAGTPVAKDVVARRVVDAYRSEIDRAGEQAMDEAETAALAERMKGHRFGVMARRAEEISVYASVESLLGADPLAYSDIPSEVPSGSLDETDALRWQMDYWLVQDLLRAVDLANRTEDGLATEVPRSAVKRIVSIRLSQLDIPEKPEEGAKPAEPASDPDLGRGGLRSAPRSPFQGFTPPSAGGSSASTTVTHTGRKAADKNGVYLVRHATISVVASSADLVSVLESFGSANFMTVTGVDITEIDRWADMDEGYYYGPDHVVRADIDIEAAYLHFWLADVVPGFVATAWGIEKPVAQTDAAP